MKRDEAENIVMNWMLDVFRNEHPGMDNTGSYTRRLLAKALLHMIEDEVGMAPPEITFEGLENEPITARIWE